MTACARSLLILICGLALCAACSSKPKLSKDELGTAEPEREQAASAEPKAESEPEKPAIPRDPRSLPDDSESVDGYRVIRARTKSGETTSVQVKPPAGWDVLPAPTEPDPHAGAFSLEEATKGLPKEGELAAQIKTSLGSFYCNLLVEKAPNTVANFVGLARGLRKFWDSEKVAWTARPYYDGTIFHRVIPGFMIQGGDHTGTGTGGIGYMIKDEVPAGAKHDRGGLLCMANRGPNTNEAQFFITEGVTKHLDGGYTIFGECEPVGLVQRIARVPQQGPGNTPITKVVIERVLIKRVPGGAQRWMPKSARLPAMGAVPQGRAVEVTAPK